MNIGILSIGVFLPEGIRTNDWWSKDVVASWEQKKENFLATLTPKTKGEQMVANAFANTADDPFAGSRERRIAPESMSGTQMEALAVRNLFQNSALSPSRTGALLCHTTVPDHLITNHACTVHESAGLPSRCFSIAVESACSSFLHQLALAEGLILSGRVDNVLLTQSCLFTRLIVNSRRHSPWFGDGATAVLVGKVPEGRGILGTAHRTDGKLQDLSLIHISEPTRPY